MPKGFFDSKEEDAKAQGIKLPTAKDREVEWQQFQKVVEEQLVQVGGAGGPPGISRRCRRAGHHT